MAPSGSQAQWQQAQNWVHDHPALAVACIAAAYPVAHLLRPWLLSVLPYALLVVVLAGVRFMLPGTCRLVRFNICQSVSPLMRYSRQLALICYSADIILFICVLHLRIAGGSCTAGQRQWRHEESCS